MANTKFYVFEVTTPDSNGYALKEIISAESVSIPRKKVEAEYPDGRYVILADTSGIVTKTSKTVTETAISFEAPRKERKPKAPPAAKPEAKKTTPPVEKKPGSGA